MVRKDGKTASSRKKAWKVILCFLLIFCILYALLAFSDLSFFKKLRHMAIETSMSTMRHQWVAYAIFPKPVVEEVRVQILQAREEQSGIETDWQGLDSDFEGSESFFETFYEIDKDSLLQYVSAQPELLAKGWDNLYINEAGLDDDGTDIITIHGDQVLAIDAANGILLVRVKDTGYRGVLAIGKDPAKLSLKMAHTLGDTGQEIGIIAEKSGGVLAVTASGFDDVDKDGNEGQGNGGVLNGYAMSDGTAYGEHLETGFKRVEIHKDDHFYITDSISPVDKNCRDAAEFTPALIVDGEVVVDEGYGWNSVNPRACIGQSENGEIMMLCIEGRMLSSIGCGVVTCAEIMKQYNCVQALNMDGGTSAILWYRGECVTRCCNEDYPNGRPIPNAFVYAGTM